MKRILLRVLAAIAAPAAAGAQSPIVDWVECEGMAGDAVVSGVVAPIDPEFPGRIHRISLIRRDPDYGWCLFEWADSQGVSGPFGFASLAPGEYTLAISGFRIENRLDTVTVEAGQHRELSLFFGTSNLLRDCLQDPACRRVANSFPPIRITSETRASALERLGLRLAAMIGSGGSGRTNVACLSGGDDAVRDDLAPLFLDVVDREECARRGELVSNLHHVPTNRRAVLLSIDSAYQRSDGTYVIEFMRSSGNRSGAGYECVARADQGFLIPESCWLVWIT